jgi:hypothetical protein
LYNKVREISERVGNGGNARMRFKLMMNVTGIAITPSSMTPNPTNSPPGLCENITAVPIKSCKHMGSIT